MDKQNILENLLSEESRLITERVKDMPDAVKWIYIQGYTDCNVFAKRYRYYQDRKIDDFNSVN